MKSKSHSEVIVSRPENKLKRQTVIVEVGQFCNEPLTNIKVIDRYNAKDTTDFDYTWTLQGIPLETLEVLKNHIQNAINYINNEK